MSLWQFLLRSLAFHWRMHLAVALGVAAATAVLTGALLVGDSVRGSLKHLALDRLGKIDQALITDRFFRQQTIGALNLFAHPPVQLPPEDVRVAQAFADIATIAILQERLVKEREVLAAQLQTALDSRVIIEQAKGVLGERLGLDMDTTFSTLRDAARRTSRRLSDVAREVVERRGRTDLLP